MATEASLQVEYEKVLDNIKLWGSKLFLVPFIGRSKAKMFGFYVITFLVLFTSLQLLITLCVTGFSDLVEIINIAPNIGASMMSAMKYSQMHSNRKTYNKIYDHFNGKFWNLLPEHSKTDVKILTQYLRILKGIKSFLTIIAFCLIIIVDSFPFLIMTYEQRMLKKDVQHLYPFDAWYPFDKVKWYSVTYIWESLMTAIVIFLYTFSNLVHSSYITYICLELKLLGCWIEDLISPDDIQYLKGTRKLKIYRNIQGKLRIIIKRYNFLYELSSALNLIMGDVMLFSYGLGSIFICLTAYSTTVVDDDDVYKFLRYLSFFLSLIVDVFIQCIIGQVLIDHSQALATKISSSNWIYGNIETKKILLMMIARTQRPFKLTAKGYVTMDLNTFCRVCGSSYSYFNLLRTVYHP